MKEDKEDYFIDIENIKKGRRYLCIRQVYMKFDKEKVWYKKGKIYISEQDGAITDEKEHKDHYWTKKGFSETFIRIYNKRKNGCCRNN